MDDFDYGEGEDDQERLAAQRRRLQEEQKKALSGNAEPPAAMINPLAYLLARPAAGADAASLLDASGGGSSDIMSQLSALISQAKVQR